MTILSFNKPSATNMPQLTSEILAPMAIVGQYIQFFQTESLELTETQKTAIQTIIDNHVPSVVIESVLVNGDELMACMETDAEIDAVLSNAGALALLQFLGLRDQQIKLSVAGANRVMTYLVTKTLISTTSRDVIKLMLENKGLVFPA